MVVINIVVFDAWPRTVVALSVGLPVTEIDPMRNAVNIQIFDRSKDCHICFTRIDFVEF